MRYLRILSLAIVLLSVNRLSAQQDPNFTLYNFNMNIINPAYAGSNEFSEVNLAYRSQWAGVPNSPNTQTLSYSKPMKNNLGLGLSVVNDEVFVLQETDIAIDISYKLQLSETHLLYFGLKSGAGFTHVDLTKTGAPENDPLFTSNKSFLTPHVGAGLYLKHEKYYLTLSTPNFLNGKRYEKQGNVPIAVINDLHVYLGGGYTFRINKNLDITPALMSRHVNGAPTSYDVSSTLDLYKRMKFGLNYRIDETVSIYSLFTTVKKLKFGFAYDINASKITNANTKGSIEMILKYQWK